MMDLLSILQRYAAQASVISSFQNLIVFLSNECSFRGTLKIKRNFISCQARKRPGFCRGFGMNIAVTLPVGNCRNLSLSAFSIQCFAQKMNGFSRKIKQGG